VAKELFATSKRFGCSGVHIGGGEPFLNFQGLLEVLRVARDQGIYIEYIETNSSWYKSLDDAAGKLEQVRELGVGTLLISVSPFHLEYIPFKKVQGVVEACRKVGINRFLWTETFYHLFKRLDPSRRYSLEALEAELGVPLKKLIGSYWLHPGGRALETFFKGEMKASEVVAFNPGGCKELADTSHFHLDLYGNYVPGLCAGLSIWYEDLGKELDVAKYPVISTLYSRGVGGLLEYAQDLGFKPKDDGYGSKCSLCFEIRKFLSSKKKDSPELNPVWHYKF